MPPKKKVQTEGKAAIPPVVWQRLADDGQHWESFATADAALLDVAIAAKLPTVAVNEMSYAKGSVVTFDLEKFTETCGGQQRPIRRLTPGVWEWKDDNGLFVQFYDDDNAMIESAWRGMAIGTGEAQFSTTNLSFNAGFGSKYTFTLATQPKNGELKGLQLNEDSGTKRELRRSTADVALAVWDTKNFGISAMKPPPDLPSPPAAAEADAGVGLQRAPSFASTVMSPPATWQPQTKPLEFFDVLPGTKEFDDVTKPFLKKLSQKTAKIITVRRIQNEPLWKFYALTRYRVAQRNGGDPNEQDQLYHGCRVRQNLDSIIEFGFDMRVARDGLAGLGIYFALQSSYSNGGYVLQNPDKSKEMLVCRVAVGSHTQGLHGMKRPPEKKNGSGELYDSVSRLPQMYVVFDNCQAYPEYIIKYKH